MNTIQSKWAEFEKLMLPKGGNFSATQRREMKRAFYCGAQSVLVLMYDMSDGAVSENAGIHMIQQWHEECQQFAEDIARGKA